MRNEVSSIGSVQPIELDAGELRDAWIGHHAQGRQRGFGHPVEQFAVVLVAGRPHRDAARRHLERHLGNRRHHVGELGPAERSVQHRDMVRIDHILEVLQPVAGDHGRSAATDRAVVGLHEFVLVHIFQGFVARQHRFSLGRSQIGEDQPVAFPDRVPGLSHLVPELAAVDFAGLLKAVAFDVEFPAMVAAADAVFLDLAVVQRGAAVAAARVQQASAAMPVAEQNEVLAEHADFSGYIAGVGDEANRMPVASQQFPHRRAAADGGEFGSAAGGPHRIAGAEIAIPLADVHRRLLRSCFVGSDNVRSMTMSTVCKPLAASGFAGISWS